MDDKTLLHVTGEASDLARVVNYCAFGLAATAMAVAVVAIVTVRAADDHCPCCLNADERAHSLAPTATSLSAPSTDAASFQQPVRTGTPDPEIQRLLDRMEKNAKVLRDHPRTLDHACDEHLRRAARAALRAWKEPDPEVDALYDSLRKYTEDLLERH